MDLHFRLVSLNRWFPNKVFVASALLVALVNAIPVDIHGYGIEDQGDYSGGHHEDYHTEPEYSYHYGVHDPHTGDEKQHIEERHGDLVKGQYMLKEADGTTRVVDYQADKHNGFNAVVHKIGEPQHQEYVDHGHHY